MIDRQHLPFVSVIVPAYNDPRLVLALDALRGQTYDRGRYEIVVCDNGSQTDVAPDVERVAKDVAARTVYEPTPGSYSARNAAMYAACGSILAFTDADCLPAADWLASAVAAMTRPDPPHLVAGRVDVFACESRPTPAEVYETVDAFPQRLYVERHRFGATANLIVRRAVVDGVGPFDAALRSGGDREFCNRAVAAGFTIAYDDDVVVRHPARRTLTALRRKQRRTSRGLFDNGLLRPTVRDVLVGLRPPLRSINRTRQRPELQDSGLWARYAVARIVIHYGMTIDQLRYLTGTMPRHR